MKNPKNKKNKNKESRYITYYQSVMTIGVMTEAKNQKEALKKSKEKLKDKNIVNHCFFEQTPFELTYIEKDVSNTNGIPDSLKISIPKNENTRNIMATRAQKQPSEFNNEEYVQFIRDSIEI